MMKALILVSGSAPALEHPTVIFVGSNSDRAAVLAAINAELTALAGLGSQNAAFNTVSVGDVVIDGGEVTVGDTLDSESMVFVKHSA